MPHPCPSLSVLRLLLLLLGLYVGLSSARGRNIYLHEDTCHAHAHYVVPNPIRPFVRSFAYSKLNIKSHGHKLF